MRELYPDLQTLIYSKVRMPAFKLYVYEAGVDDYTAIITGTNTQQPLDVTEYVVQLQWQPSQLTFTLNDGQGLIFHPDTGAYAGYMSDGAIFRLKEGDARVSEDHWIWTFTGQLKGQAGWRRSRTNQALECRGVAYSRENAQVYKRRSITTKKYTVGTDIATMIKDVSTVLGVTSDEIKIGDNLGFSFQHQVNQVSQEAPWDIFTVVLEVVSKVPFFDGDGRLSAYSKDMMRTPDLVLSDWSHVFDFEVTQASSDPVNRVVVEYLSSTLSEVEGTSQKLGTANITTGFFTWQEKITCFWSEDRKQRAKNTYMKTIKSVNDNLLPVGSESYDELDAFSGEITVNIDVWVAGLAGASMAAYIACAAIPDKQADTVVCSTPVPVQVAIPAGTGTTVGPIISTSTPAGFTIPWGRIREAAALSPMLLTMMSLGSAQYEIWGTPYDLVYKKMKVIAVEDGLDYWQENEVKIDNDFLGIASQAETVAIRELLYRKSASFPRKLTMINDPSLELGDIIQLPDGKRFYIESMQKSIKRGEPMKLELSGFMAFRY